MLQHIYLIRHGETDWNREGRAQGQHDVQLNGKGREQARQIGAFLAGIHPAAVISSGLSRARETAEIISHSLGLDPVIHPELRERDMGKFSGLTRQEIQAYGVTDLSHWDGLPGVETDEDLLKRVLPCLQQFIGTNDGDGVVITHGGVIRVLFDHFMGINTKEHRRFALHNGLVAVFQINMGHFMLESLVHPELIKLMGQPI
jgi:broad specificity phosphatase PhoE